MYALSGGKCRGRVYEEGGKKPRSVSLLRLRRMKPSCSFEPLDVISVKDMHLQGGVLTSRMRQSTKLVGSQRFYCLKLLRTIADQIYGDRRRRLVLFRSRLQSDTIAVQEELHI